MNLDRLDGRKKPGLDRDRLETSVAATLARLPDSYRLFLTLSDGIELRSGTLLYGSGELAERNDTYQVSIYLPGHIAIGDDGGGRMFLLRESGTSPVLCVDMGAIGSVPPEVIAESLDAWIEQGCPGAATSVADDAALPDFADIYLVAIPGGKLANLIAVKNELGLNLGMAELKALAADLPACLAKGLPFGKFRKRCDALNARFGHCLSQRWN